MVTKNAKIRDLLNRVIFKISKTPTGFCCSGLPVKKLRQTVRFYLSRKLNLVRYKQHKYIKMHSNQLTELEKAPRVRQKSNI